MKLQFLISIVWKDNFFPKKFNCDFKRSLDPKVIKFKSSESASGNSIRQIYDIIDGIDQETSKSITKKIKDTKLKVQAKIQGNELRISGQKRDNLQEAISVIKEMKLDLPLQFVNMRD